jgi:ABC-2 type transport system ATP-binding protein
VVLTTHYIDEAEHLAKRLILLAGGKVVADTTPEHLRAQGGPATIRYHLPDGAPIGDLPASLAPHFDPAAVALVVRVDDPTGPLRDLVGWAGQHHLDLSRLEVGPPSLEDAYLAAIGQPTPEGTLS